MTLKEQIMKLQTYKMYEGEDTVYVERDDVIKALEQESCECKQVDIDKFKEILKNNPPIISVLEQEPCEDCISREETILHLSERLYETAMNNQGYEITMDKACEDIALNRLKTWINELPSVTPKAESEDKE